MSGAELLELFAVRALLVAVAVGGAFAGGVGLAFLIDRLLTRRRRSRGRR